MTVSLLISAVGTCIGNLLVFSAIPFAWWLFRHRKEHFSGGLESGNLT